MNQQNVLRGALTILIASGVVWVLASCATTPKEKPVEPVTPLEFQAAQDAIAEAEAAGAVQYAPEPLSQARGALDQAKEKATADPTAARTLLKTSIEKAHEARDAALAAKAAEWKTKLDALDQQAVDAIAEAEAAGAAQQAPALLGEAKDALTLARTQAPSDPEKATTSYETAIDKAHQARGASMDTALKAEFDALDQQARDAIAEAVDAGAETLAADLLAQARQALTQAQGQVYKAPTDARTSYKTSIDRAHAARDAANQAALTSLDQAAQQAIAGAEAVEADRYSPALLNEARQALTDGRAQSATPAKAKVQLTLSATKANQARDEASKARTAALLARLDEASTKLKSLQAWDPESADPLLAQAATARAAVEADYTTGLPQANEVLVAIDGLNGKLSSRLLAVQDLRVQAQTALDEAESVDAYVWVPELVEAANDAFFAGTGAWKKFHIDAAEEGWSNALFQARSATAKAKAEQQRKQTEKLMLETMKKLEEASGKTIVDPQDNIIGPQPWDGTKELEKLKKKPLSLLIPSDGSVAVLGDKQRVTYLDEAKDQWTQGVQALNAGDLTLANESFLQAQKLIDTYMAMAVDKIYTVRLIPDRRDSLWRISEYKGIYGSPWDWPRIWKRNQKLIQNPDLIYPGWQLIIPPQ